MKDLRIVVVSWNVETLLDRCLRSLPDACRGLDWECVVVDNASSDGSVESARRVAAEHPRIRVIGNRTNVGFGTACNQGAAGSDARYFLFLNPDTFCHPDSLARFVRLADEHPKAGIFGPKLTNPDGSVQASVRRFPNVWNQSGILLKLHHAAPRLATFRKYFAQDIDPAKEQNVDQVMGACFLVRRECWNDIGGFDERFFIWFEEVDRCKSAREKGWDVRYLPQISVVHHGGESFAQVFSTKKQRYFNASLIAYFEKWHAGWRTSLLKALAPISVVESWSAATFRIPWFRWLFLSVATIAGSRATLDHPIAQTVVVGAIAVTLFGVTLRKPAIALAAIALERFVGSQGHLFAIGPVSLREAMFVSFFLGWIPSVVAKRGWNGIWRMRKNLLPYLALAALVVYASLRGAMMGNLATLWSDANAWLDLLLLIPVIDVARRFPPQVKREFSAAFCVGIGWLAAFSLGFEYLYSRGLAAVRPPSDLTRWIRGTGLGEITPLAGNAHRIFLPSHIYAVVALIAGAAFFFSTKRFSKIAFAGAALAAVSLVASLSRSFWLGSVAGLVVVIATLVAKKRFSVRGFIPFALAGAAGVLLFSLVITVPITSLLFGRATISDPAASSRQELLGPLISKIEEHPILGSGFGATVTFTTKDPRFLESHPGGRRTTFAFEWGWLEHWIKFGILGIPVLLWVLVSLVSRMWKSEEDLRIRVTFIASLVALSVIHVFTPYLNHPLGFLLLFVGEGIIASSVLSDTTRHPSPISPPVGRA